LMRDLTRKTGTSLPLITHDMGVVAEMADRMAVMRQGRLVETGPARRIFAAPAQGYTRDLLAAVLRMDAPPRSDSPLPRTQAPCPLRASVAASDARAVRAGRCASGGGRRVAAHGTGRDAGFGRGKRIGQIDAGADHGSWRSPCAGDSR
jgi:peptide/nickel transport system ATP-binding protein